MRVISGEAKGRPLLGPAGTFTRPMQDKIKEALFSMLWSLGVEPDRIADLYAGTGAIGIEANQQALSEQSAVGKPPSDFPDALSVGGTCRVNDGQQMTVAVTRQNEEMNRLDVSRTMSPRGAVPGKLAIAIPKRFAGTGRDVVEGIVHAGGKSVPFRIGARHLLLAVEDDVVRGEELGQLVIRDDRQIATTSHVLGIAHEARSRRADGTTRIGQSTGPPRRDAWRQVGPCPQQAHGLLDDLFSGLQDAVREFPKMGSVSVARPYRALLHRGRRGGGSARVCVLRQRGSRERDGGHEHTTNEASTKDRSDAKSDGMRPRGCQAREPDFGPEASRGGRGSQRISDTKNHVRGLSRIREVNGAPCQ